MTQENFLAVVAVESVAVEVCVVVKVTVVAAIAVAVVITMLAAVEFAAAEAAGSPSYQRQGMHLSQGRMWVPNKEYLDEIQDEMDSFCCIQKTAVVVAVVLVVVVAEVLID